MSESLSLVIIAVAEIEEVGLATSDRGALLLARETLEHLLLRRHGGISLSESSIDEVSGVVPIVQGRKEGALALETVNTVSRSVAHGQQVS